METKRILLKLCLTPCLGGIIAVSACYGGTPGFESIKYFYSNYRGTDPMISIVADKDSPLPDGIDQQYWTQSLTSIDFSKYVVVFVFHGWQPVWSNMEFRVVRVSDNDGEMDITTAALMRSAGSVVSEFQCPTEAVKMRKTAIHRFGKITFRLTDENGKEMASKTAMISP